MKTVRIKGGKVAEIIPDYALPVEQWYGPDFAAQCMEAPDEVGQRWTYNKETGEFAPPDDTPKPHMYTDLEIAQQDITDQELDTIELGQSMTDLELMIMEGYHV